MMSYAAGIVWAFWILLALDWMLAKLFFNYTGWPHLEIFGQTFFILCMILGPGSPGTHIFIIGPC